MASATGTDGMPAILAAEQIPGRQKSPRRRHAGPRGTPRY
jgi:hypothetical protein